MSNQAKLPFFPVTDFNFVVDRSQYKRASPWPNEDVSFNFTNFPYPVFHTHEYFEIYVNLDGVINHCINGREYLLKPGDCWFIRPNDKHCLVYPSDISDIGTYMSLNFLLQNSFVSNVFALYSSQTYNEILETTSPLIFSLDYKRIEKIKKTCLSIQTLDTSNIQSNVTTCKTIVLSLLNELMEQFNNPQAENLPQWLQDFIVTLQNPENFHKTIPELIEPIPYSYSFISKQFKRYLGVSIINYLNMVKINCAKDLLSISQMSTLQISTYLGYDSLSHLNHRFKEAFGITPMEYQKKVQNSEI